jgi:glutamyl-tRNA synthetase
MSVVTRFAPSPTGYLHIGGVRTALFCWLFARHHGGRFLLRIEDTDRERSTPESIDAILDGMRWVGLEPDAEPVFQSQRFDRYREVAERLLADGQAYHCYCRPAELEERRARQMAAGQNPGYDGRCRDRVEPRAGVEPVVRFRMPDDGETVVEDLVRGRVVFDNAEFDDLIILRSDGTPTYHFSVVVDDAAMEVSHVIRGDDHLGNTPKQIHMIRALGLPVPAYAHVPMILGQDGSRMSKRHGAVNVLEYREQGYLPDALLNYLVRLGWSHGDQEMFSRDEMVTLFDLADVNPSASRFDEEKLRWLNQQYIQGGNPSDLAPLLAHYLVSEGLDPTAGPDLAEVVAAYRERAVTLRELAESCWYLFRDFDAPDAAAAKKHLRPVVQAPMQDFRARCAQLGEWRRDALHDAIQQSADAHGLGFGKLGQPLRVALTGGPVSPPIDVTAELVGRDRGLRRLDSALDLIARRAAASA